MSQHNYTNPAFCQQSEFYPTPSSSVVHNQSMPSHRHHQHGARVHRSISMRSVNHQKQRQPLPDQTQHTQFNQVTTHTPTHRGPPRPGPKPKFYDPIPHHQRTTSRPQLAEGFALVPLADLPNNDKGRYAFIPAQEAKLLRSTSVRRMAKSQDDLDCCGHRLQSSTNDVRDSSFTSLPPNVSTSSHNESSMSGSRLKSAFSTDFVANKSLVLFDQKSQQRYAIVPTAEDEELVDANEEIIQMHNGRAHRYAVIPTASDDEEEEEEEEDETCLSGSDFEMSPINEKYATIKAAPPGYRNHKPSAHPQPLYTSSPLKPPTTPSNHRHHQHHQRQPQPDPIDQRTPTKNHFATQKLFEILSTPPRKTHPEDIDDYRTPTQNPSRSRYHSQQIISSTPKQSDFTPHRLHYDPAPPAPPPASTQPTTIDRHQRQLDAAEQQRRTTAIISPRLAKAGHPRSLYGGSEYDGDDLDKTWQQREAAGKKVSRATATIGAVSLMLILAGAMNSGLCLYMISVVSVIICVYFVCALKESFYNLPVDKIKTNILNYVNKTIESCDLVSF